MDHLSHPSVLHRGGERVYRSTVREVDLEEDRVADPRGVTRRQVVCHQHVPARAAQQPDDVCADVTGTTCHEHGHESVSYTHLRAHETRHDLVCRLLLEKK